MPLLVASCNADALAILSSSIATTQSRALVRYSSTSSACSSLTIAIVSGASKWRLTIRRLFPIVFATLLGAYPAAASTTASCFCAVVSGNRPLHVLCGERLWLRFGTGAGADAGGRTVPCASCLLSGAEAIVLCHVESLMPVPPHAVALCDGSGCAGCHAALGVRTEHWCAPTHVLPLRS